MEEKELTTEEMLEIVKKFREEEGKRLSSMSEDEIIEDYKKTQEESLKIAKELGIETVKPNKNN